MVWAATGVVFIRCVVGFMVCALFGGVFTCGGMLVAVL